MSGLARSGDLPSPASSGLDTLQVVDLPDGWKTPDLILVLAATPRSGSNMLAGLIDSTGLFRSTAEYFNSGYYLVRDGLRDASLTYKLSEMDKHSRTRSNLLSTKLFPGHFTEALRSDLLDKAFATARYVHLVRRDILGQAISQARATGTDKWQSDVEGNGSDPEYDEAAISREMAALSEYERWWRVFFASRDVPVLQVVYEDLDADPEREIGRIVSFLGFDPGKHPARLSELRLSKQRDEISDEWRRLYLASNPNPELARPERPVPRTLRNFVRFLKGSLPLR